MADINGIEYGVTFGNKHTIKDWGIYLKTRPEISPPSPKTLYVDIPGADGSIDLSDALTGEIAYSDRTITFTFAVVGDRSKWTDTYSDIADYLHGQKLKVILDEDPTYYYIGRMAVNKWKSSRAFSTLTINGTVEPYKYELASGIEDWLWDPFNFKTGIIREYSGLQVSGTLTLVIRGRRKSVTPVFIVTGSSGLTVTYNSTTYSLMNGSNKIVGVVLKEGDNTLTFSGTGTVSVDYRGGRL